MNWLSPLALALCCAQLSSAAGAQAPPAGPRSRLYVAGLLGTTPAYRPAGGPWDGFQHDLSANLGLGRFLGSKWALELDAGATFVSGDYVSSALTPGALYALTPSLYLAARAIVPVDPEFDLVLFPGVGLTHSFSNGLAPFIELNLARSLDRRDLGLSVTVGLLYNP